MEDTTNLTPKEKRKLQRLQERRQDIIDVARDLFLEKGYENTVMTDIVQYSGYSRATLYKSFSSKEELYLSVASLAFTRLHESMVQEIAAKGQSISSLGHAYLKFIETFPEYAYFIDIRRLTDLSMTIQKKVSREEHLSTSELEYIQILTQVDSLLMDTISANLTSYGVELDPRIIATMVSNFGMTIKDLLRGSPMQDEIKATLPIMFTIIEKGLEHYE